MKALNVTDVVAIVTFIQNQKGKYAKQALTTLEREGCLDPTTRKVVLDNFNNLARALCKGFGYIVEE